MSPERGVERYLNSSPTERLAALLGEKEPRPHYYEAGLFHPNQINVLVQPRRTFEETDLLSEDIAAKGLLNPLTVACFDRDGCTRYLKVINFLWQTDYQTENLVSSVGKEDEESYLILIAGERRFRAIKRLQETSCETCQEEYGPGGCYKRHFKDGVEARLCIDISPLQALFLQASENIHMRVPPHEEAKFYYQLYFLIKETEPNYSRRKFAKAVGRSESTIRKAMKFCELPIQVQKLLVEAIERKEISYGFGVEIARLQAIEGVNESELIWWTHQAILGRYKLEDFRNAVKEYIYQIASGQTMLGLFEEEQWKVAKRSKRRRVVEGEILFYMHLGFRYIDTVRRYIDEGLIPKIFSERSPRNVIRKQVEALSKISPYLREPLGFSKRECEEIRKGIKELEQVVVGFDEYEPDQPPNGKVIFPN